MGHEVAIARQWVAMGNGMAMGWPWLICISSPPLELTPTAGGWQAAESGTLWRWVPWGRSRQQRRWLRCCCCCLPTRRLQGLRHIFGGTVSCSFTSLLPWPSVPAFNTSAPLFVCRAPNATLELSGRCCVTSNHFSEWAAARIRMETTVQYRVQYTQVTERQSGE